MKHLLTTLLCLSFFMAVNAQPKQRARQLGIPFEGNTGANNAITDVPGVLVGYKTIIRDTGDKAIRTGVTVILPKGKTPASYPAGWFTLNGDGEMTGTTYIEEYGTGFSAIGITNTNSVGVVRDAIGEWNQKQYSRGEAIDFSFGLPVAAETWDGILNNISALAVKKEDVWEALDSARSGRIAEGNVGGGTGMSLFLFKGGSGTSSRTFRIDSTNYTLGVFVQGNFGGRNDLMIAGVPVGAEIKDRLPIFNTKPKDGSIIVVIATNAPLLPSQLKQVAKRASLGVARTGGLGRNGSGDIFLALSTVEPKYNATGSTITWTSISKDYLDKVYQACIYATEEAIINALVAAETMKGYRGNTIFGIPLDGLKDIMKKYNRLNTSR